MSKRTCTKSDSKIESGAKSDILLSHNNQKTKFYGTVKVPFFTYELMPKISHRVISIDTDIELDVQTEQNNCNLETDINGVVDMDLTIEKCCKESST